MDKNALRNHSCARPRSPRAATGFHGRRPSTLPQRRAIERRRYTLLVHRMAGFVQCREYCIAKVVLVDASGDSHVAARKARAERMMRKVKPATVEIVAQALSDIQGKFKLGCFGKSLPQAGVVGDRLLANRTHHRGKLAFELAEEFEDRCRGHTLIGIVDVRISDVLVRRKVGGIFPAEIERPFEIGHHGRKVVRRPIPGPCVLRGGAVGVRPRDMVRRYLDHLLKVAASNADQAGVVSIVRQALAVMGKRVEQLAECRCDRLLVCQTLERRALTAPSVGTPSRHVGRLIPIQHVARRGQIADLAQAPLELNQLLLGRASVARRLAAVILCRAVGIGLRSVACELGLIQAGVIPAKSQAPGTLACWALRRAALTQVSASIGSTRCGAVAQKDLTLWRNLFR